MCELSPVSFHGDTIFCVEIDGQPYSPIKPIVENMGLNWGAQSTKLRTNKERWGIAIIAIPSEGGEQETTCLPVRKLPAWLASINPKKVKPELRAKIELYQNECDDALWNYWMKGKAERAAKAPAPGAINSLEDLYALRLAQYQHLRQPEREQMRLRIYRRLARSFGTSSLAKLAPEQWAKAVALITAPTQKTSNNGICGQSLETRATQPEFVQAIPDFDLAKLPEAFDELLKTADFARESLKKMESLIDYATPCGHNPNIDADKRAVVDNAKDLVQIARGNLKACEYALRSFARLSSRINFLTLEPLKLA